MMKYKTYARLYTNFIGHEKTKFLFKKYGILGDSVVKSLVWLWIHCRTSYQDGIIKKDAESIELMVDWLGEDGKFIEIITSRRTRFIEKISENEYHVPKWFFYNDDLNASQQENISKQNSKNAHAKYRKPEIELLKRNSIDIEKCKWLYWNDDERLTVKIDNMPKHTEIVGEYFEKLDGFWEWFNNGHSSSEQGNVLGKIKEHTKKCTKCKKYFISESSSTCYECRGKT